MLPLLANTPPAAACCECGFDLRFDLRFVHSHTLLPLRCVPFLHLLVIPVVVFHAASDYTITN